MRTVLLLSCLVSVVLTGAIFGFFYAWVCSTMWGLDAAAPDVAIRAMQAMNESVRNAVFAPAFFATPFACFISAGLAFRLRFREPALLFAAAGAVYLFGGMILTMAVNVPMNEALAQVEVPGDPASAESIWTAYSPRWQFWNQVRTVASGIALLLAALGLFRLGQETGGSADPGSAITSDRSA